MTALPDRTLSLLKAGAKTLAYKSNSSMMDSTNLPVQHPSPCKFRSASNLKQMLLTDKLQLKASNKVVNVSHRTAFDTWTILLWLFVLFPGCPSRPLWMWPIDRSVCSECMLLLWSGAVFLLSIRVYQMRRIVLSELLSICVSINYMRVKVLFFYVFVTVLFCFRYNCEEQIMCLNCCW